MPIPRSATELRSSFRLDVYCLRFICWLTDNCSALHSGMSRKKTFVCTENMECKFIYIKNALIKTFVLTFQNFYIPFVFEMDAYDFSVGRFGHRRRRMAIFTRSSSQVER